MQSCPSASKCLFALLAVLVLGARAAPNQAPGTARPAPAHGPPPRPTPSLASSSDGPLSAANAPVVEVPVECAPPPGAAEDADVVLCHPVRTAGLGTGSRDARLLGRIGFLTGLHLGGAISSSGSLSASHSLNVFGKVMNTALSVSYGPNGLYQGGWGQGGRPPLSQGPGFGGLGDDPNAPGGPSGASGVSGTPSSSTSSTSSTSSASAVASAVASPGGDKDGEVGGAMAGTGTRDATKPGIARIESATATEAPETATPQNRLPVAEDIAPAPVTEEVDEGHGVSGGVSDSGEDGVGQELLPEQGSGLRLASQRRAQLEAVARVRTPSVDEQRKLFLEHHNKHVAAFNRHFAKYNGDVSRVAVFSRQTPR